jgi:hypothetical protein
MGATTAPSTEALLDTTTSSDSSDESSVLSASEDEGPPPMGFPGAMPPAYEQLLQRFGATPSVPLARRE